MFDCRAFAHVSKELRQKLDSKAKEYIFVGYCEDSKGYRLMAPDTKKITNSRDVIFLEEFKEKDSGRTISAVQLQSVEEQHENKNTKIEEKEKDDAVIEITESNEEISNSMDNDNRHEPDRQRVDQTDLPRRSARVPKPKRNPNFVCLAMSNNTHEPETIEETLNSTESRQ